MCFAIAAVETHPQEIEEMKKQRREQHGTTRKSPKDSVHLSLCIAYVGSAFRGLQLQAHAPTHHTVEGVVVHALRDAGVIDRVDGGRIADANHFFSRSCRTDKGVHAVRNLVSLFIPAERFHSKFEGSAEAVKDCVNKCLPPPVKVLSVVRVMPNFSPKNCCNRRVYRYYLPAYALVDAKVDGWAAFFKAFPDAHAYLCSDATERASFDNLECSSSSKDEVQQQGWKSALAAVVHRINSEVTSQFVGSHRFHNFTVDMDGSKSQAKVISSLSDESIRCISRCEIAPRVYYVSRAESGPSRRWVDDLLADVEKNTDLDAETQLELEQMKQRVKSVAKSVDEAATLPSHLPFVVFQVEGTSFLLNMIRKMVGSVLAVARGARPSIISDSLSPAQRTSVPMAPGPYLALSLSTYSGYDSVVRTANELRLAKEKEKDERLAARMATGEARVDGFGNNEEKRAAIVASLYQPLEDAWNQSPFLVDKEAEQYFASQVVPEIVDADLNRFVPLDTVLFVRDWCRTKIPAIGSQDARDDHHLKGMKEFVPSKPVVCPPAASEMTVFLRQLRVHNWNLRPVKIPTGSKVEKELANKVERAAKDADATELASRKRERGEEDVDDDRHADVFASIPLPPCHDDGWLYVGRSIDDEVAARNRVHLDRFLWSKRVRRLLPTFRSEEAGQSEEEQSALLEGDGSLVLDKLLQDCSNDDGD